MPTPSGCFSFGFAVLSCALVACGAPPESGHPSGTTSSPSTAPTPSAAPSPSTPVAPVATTTPPSPTPDPTAPGNCGKTLAAYCAGASCLATWSDADTVCMNAAPTALGSVQMSASCGSSFFALQQGGTTAYYDTTTSALVAVADAAGSCLGGPGDFVAPAAAACILSPCGAMNCGGEPDSGI